MARRQDSLGYFSRPANQPLPEFSMFKSLQEFWERLRRNPGKIWATVQVNFYPNKTARSRLEWHEAGSQQRDTVSLAVFFYARLLFELAELNETRVANELIAFISQVADVILTGDGAPNRPQLPMGELTLNDAASSGTPSRTYQGDFFQQTDGQFRLDFNGSRGKEGIYLPAAYVVFLQDCINELPNDDLRRLASSLGRLHDYYKLRKDFWEGSALAAGPVFALGTGQLLPEEMAEEG